MDVDIQANTLIWQAVPSMRLHARQKLGHGPEVTSNVTHAMSPRSESSSSQRAGRHRTSTMQDSQRETSERQTRYKLASANELKYIGVLIGDPRQAATRPRYPGELSTVFRMLIAWHKHPRPKYMNCKALRSMRRGTSETIAEFATRSFDD